jgi:hypothetical protein
MHMLGIMDRVLPIGSEQWDSVVAEHSNDYPGRCKNGLMRKYSSLHRRPIPTGDPNCPEEVRLAKRIKYAIGNKASLGDAEEEFDIEGVVHGESGANPNPEPNQDRDDDPDQARSSATTNPTGSATTNPTGSATNISASNSAVTPSSTSAIKKRAYRTPNDEKKDDFLEMYRLNMLSMQQNAELDRQQRREEARVMNLHAQLERTRRSEEAQANRQMLQMIGATLTQLSTAWTAGNTGATAVFRPGEQPVIEQEVEAEEDLEPPPNRGLRPPPNRGLVRPPPNRGLRSRRLR